MRDEAGPILTDETREEIIKRIAEGLTPMEPRILLDAVLDLSGGLDDSAELLFAVSAALQDHSDELNRVFDGVEDAFTQHIAGSDDTYDPTDPDGATDILFAGIRAALDAHVAAFEAELGAFVSAETETLTTFLNNALQTEFGANVGTLELEQNILGFPLPISDAELLFTAENLADRAGFGDDAINQVGGSLAAADQARLGDFLAGSFLDYAASQGEDIFTIDIADGQVGSAQYSVQQGADQSEVLLSASAGDLRLNPDSFIGFFVADDPNETFRVPVQNFDFDGVITVDANGDDYNLIADGFDIQEFTIGGFAINEDPNQIGFEQEGADGTAFNGGDSFVGAVYAFDTAELRFQSSGFDGLTTTAQQNLAVGLGLASSTSTQLGFSTEIREADFSERTSSLGAFEAVVPGQEYILADFNFRQDFFPINVFSTFEPVLQPNAPVAFDTTVNRLVGSGGTGFDGLSSGDAADDVADPSFVLAGLDYILEAADEAIDFALEGLNLPIIGENLALGFTIFDDLRLDILSRAEAKTVNDDGSPVTTVDVLTGFMNDELNLLLGTSGETYLEAALGGFENTKPNFLQGNLQFSTEVFRAEIVDAFELGLDIPGLDFDFGNDNPIELISTANMNIGFGVDADGFFLLNDTNLSEISLDFRVAASDFEGNATIGGLLDITALAVDAPDRLPILEFSDTPDTDGGDLSLTASLEVDLYGEAGRTVNPRVFDLIDVTKQLGNDEVDVRYEKQVRIAELQAARNVGGSIAEVDVTGAADINIQLIGDILNPETGDRIDAIPRFVTELVVDASFSAADGGRPTLDKVFFTDLRVDAAGLYENLIAPVIDPLVPFLEPLSTLADVLDTFPLSLVLDQVSDAFPLLNIFSALEGLETAANGLDDLFELTGGFVPFGDFDVLNDRFIPLGINTLPTIPRLGETGLIIDLPILTDVTNLISLLKGEFEEVELVTASVVAVDIPEIEIDFLDTIFDAIDDLPLGGDVISELLDGLLGLAGANAELGLEAFFGFTSGYDLSGVVNFVNTQDPTRLLDSFFLETEDVLVVDLDASANIGFDAFELGTGAEAEITASAFGTSDVDIIDPNGDGKLRLNELAFLLGNASGSLDSFSDLFGSIFEGSLSFGFDVDIEGRVGIAGITTGVDENIFSFSESFGTPGGGVFDPFGFLGGGERNEPDGPDVDPQLFTTLPGDNVVLNVGARGVESFVVEDLVEPDTNGETIRLTGSGDDIVFGYTASNFTVDTDPANNGAIFADLPPGTASVVIPMGGGINVVDLIGLSDTDTLILGGDSGNSAITLPSTGFHVVVTGDAPSTINAPQDASGTYWIIGGDGFNNIVLPGGDTLVFGDKDFGIGDAFRAAFADGGFSKAAAEAVLISHLAAIGYPEGVGGLAASIFGDLSLREAGVYAALDAFAADYTVESQVGSSRTGDSFNLGLGLDEGGDGTGKRYVFAGGGSDNIVIRGGETALALGGAGNDNISIRVGGTSFAEGGAGSDTLSGGDGADEHYGYAKVLGESGETSDRGLNALANQDGNDVLVGGGGNDALFGQRGDNFIEGSAGNDTVVGGRGDDIVFGGKLAAELASGAQFDLGNVNVRALWGEVLVGREFDDGADVVKGFGGDDILFGGFGSDVLSDTAGRNILIGDNAEVAFTRPGVVESVVSVNSLGTLDGADTLTGGSGMDVIIGGEGSSGGFFNGDFITDNSGGNILIGDLASITGGVFGDSQIIESIARVGTDFGSDFDDNIIASSGAGYDTIIGGEGEEQIRARDGGNILIGGNGTVNLINGFIQSSGADKDGDDSIAIVNVDDPGAIGTPNFLIGGAGADLVSGTSFTDFIIGDDGTVDFDATIWKALRDVPQPADPANPTSEEQTALNEFAANVVALVNRIESVGAATDGDDTFGGRGGNDVVIAGGGGDGSPGDFNAVGGQGIFILDSGYADFETGFVEGVANEFAGDDQIRLREGDHIVIGGGGADLVTLGVTEFTTNIVRPGQPDEVVVTSVESPENGNGNNTILGDNGQVLIDVATRGVIFAGSVEASALDGDDTVKAFENQLEASVEAGRGDNVIILGGGADELALGDGNNFVLGDSGAIDYRVGVFTSNVDVAAGADPAAAFAGADDLRFGSGVNKIIGGGGADLILVDDQPDPNAEPVADPEAGAEADPQAADPAPAQPSGRHVILGDRGRIDFNTNTGGLEQATSLFPEFDGGDTIAGLDGSNVLMLGGGDDALTLGAGNNIIVGDGGSIDVIAGSASGAANAADGNDAITLGAGDNIVIGGGDADTISIGVTEGEEFLQASDNLILGDSGDIDYDPTTRALNVMSSTQAFNDGSDVIKTGPGSNRVIGGAGGETIDLLRPGGFGGDNIVIGGAGVIDMSLDDEPETGRAISATTAGNDADTIIVGNGADIVIAGADSDSVTDASGVNAHLGDDGLIRFDAATGVAHTMLSNARSSDGDDTLSAGFGVNHVILGGGADIAGIQGGDAILLGDGGLIALNDGQATANGSAFDGGDNLTFQASSSGLNAIAGGGGNDTIRANSGAAENFILGDSGVFDITYDFDQISVGRFTVDKLTSNADEFDGDDVVRAANGTAAILGGGADTAEIGSRPGVTRDAEGVNLIIGDSGEITLASRSMTSFADAGAGNDTITIFEDVEEFIGDNFIIGGGGADVITLGEGDNVVLADDGTITAMDSLTGRLAVGDNKATDGADNVTGGDGDNIVVGGGAADTLTLGDGANLIAGDGAEIDRNRGAGEGRITTVGFDNESAAQGDDVITVGFGGNVIVGGAGNDAITAAQVAPGEDAPASFGDNLIVASLGEAIFDAQTLAFVSAAALTTTRADRDEVTTADGDDAIIGGDDADVIRAGEGANRIIGDAGSMTLTETRSTSSASAGADQIFAGSGADTVIGGGGGDALTVGAGDNLILGDDGDILADGATLSSTSDANAGADRLFAGDGANRAILGAGADRATLGAGDNILLGDSGSINLTTGVVSDAPDARGGNDVVTAGNGASIFIGGSGADRFTLGAGGNFLLGDSGQITFDTMTGDALTLTSAHNTLDGNDTVTAQDGSNFAILGAGADSLTVGTGDNSVIMDGGTIDLVAGRMTNAADSLGGNDSVTAGDGAGRFIGGSGADDFKLGAGGNLLLGDSGEITFDPATGDAQKLISDHNALDGNDTVTAQDGSNVAVLGGGADSLTVGKGDNFVITDGGTIDLVTGEMTNTADSLGGSDSVTAGDGAGRFIGGSGADDFDLGAGGNFLLGDSGRITFNPVTGAPLTLTSDHNALDGNDTVLAKDGDNVAILGAGADSLTVGKGDNFVITDGGTIDLVTGRMANTANDLGGDDSVTAGDGAGRFIGGSGADDFDLGAGGNFLLGDSGEITFDPTTGEALTLTSGHDARDGDDTVKAKDGDNIAILGAGSDSLTVGAGNNSVITDGGSINLVTGEMTNAADSLGGSDSVTAGDGAGRFIGGSGADDFNLGAGGNFLLGDSGRITFDPVTGAPLTLTSEHNALDGNDTVLAKDGDNFAILGAGADSLTVGKGDNFAITDGGSINLVTGEMTNAADSLGGSDSVTAGDGAGRFIGGSGADDFDLGAGGNFFLGDSGRITFDPATGAPLTLTSDHNILDGDDTVNAGDGDNSAILGAGADTFTVGNGDNVVIADGGLIDLVAGRMTNAPDALGGADSLTAGDGASLLIGGSAADTFMLGDGGASFLGDSGEITFDPATRAALTLTSVNDILDGDDVATVGNGNSRAILGGGADTGVFGDGDNLILTDGGALDLVAGTATGGSDPLAGADTLTAGDGAGLVIGGAFADLIQLGDGDKTVLTDTGAVTFDPATLATLTANSIHDPLDGGDVLNAGTGLIRAILGGGADDASFGDGDNIIVADGGRIDMVAGVVETATNDLAGEDTVVAGDGDNKTLGGSFADLLTFGDGDNDILADTGSITFDPATLAGRVLTSAHDARDGEDVLSAGDGDNAVIMGAMDDTATLGDGGNILLGDAGRIDLVSGVAADASDPLSGEDDVTAGDGGNLLITGAFDDLIVTGDGGSTLLSDGGEIVFDAGSRSMISATSRFDARDGADDATMGDGDNHAILGGGRDTGVFGDGDNQLIADSGRIVEASGASDGLMASRDDATGGADAITVSDGADMIIAGDAADTVTAVDGNNVIIGDNGVIRFADAAGDRLLSATSSTPTEGGGDQIATGDGSDIVIAGQGDDSVTSGGGADIVSGDWISVETPLSGGGIGEIRSINTGVAGEDVIDAGAGKDIVLGGGENDLIEVGTGFDVALGDNGVIQYVNRADVDALAMTQQALGGDDTLSATGAGDNILAGQAGADVIRGGDDDDVLFGDIAQVAFFATSLFDAGESQVERLAAINIVNIAVGFDDLLEGGAGRDYLLAGFGADTLRGGDGQDLLAGDAFSISTIYLFDGPGAPVEEQVVFESTFAFVEGGVDLLDGGDGPDIVIGHLGPDTIVGDTASDFIAGDAAALFLRAPFSAPDFGPDRILELITVNFAGSGAGDLLSQEQVSSALGVTLTNFASDADPETGVEALREVASTGLTGEALIEAISAQARTLFEAVASVASTQSALARIADVMSLDLTPEMRADMITAELAAEIAAALEGNLSALDRYLITRMVQEIIVPALEEAEENAENEKEGEEEEAAAVADAREAA